MQKIGKSEIIFNQKYLFSFIRAHRDSIYHQYQVIKKKSITKSVTKKKFCTIKVHHILIFLGKFSRLKFFNKIEVVKI